jgi:hypothetical protein
MAANGATNGISRIFVRDLCHLPHLLDEPGMPIRNLIVSLGKDLGVTSDWESERTGLRCEDYAYREIQQNG